MFEKFTERARKVMIIARQEAQRLMSEFIGTEHILLGIIEEGGGIASKVLKRLSIDEKKVKVEIEKLITPSTSPTVTLGQLPFSPRAKRVLELADEAASQLGHDVVGTEHLLIGLLKENEGIAAQVLTNLGLKLDEVRDTVLDCLGVEPHALKEEESKGEYTLRITPGLSPSQLDEVLAAVKMIKCVDSVRKNTGVWLDTPDLQATLYLVKSTKQALDIAYEALERLRKAVETPEKKEEKGDSTQPGT